jgi:predicted nucleic acid-binding protein
MVLVDTSVWIDHLRESNKRLVALLEAETVAMHPFVLGELACGNLHNRTEIIALLHTLPQASRVEDDDVLFFIERHHIMGQGIGLIDAHLLAACHLDTALLWTRDKRLRELASALHIAFT